jgi:hypothetical protein
MSEHRFSFPACVIAGKGRIEAYDVILLRKFAFADGVTTRDQAAAMLALHRLCPDQCAEWESFFIESLAAFAVFEEAPLGRLDEANAAWLIQMFSEDGTVVGAAELDMLLHAVELAAETAESLSTFLLDQIRRAMLPDLDFDLNLNWAHALTRPPAAAITDHDLALIWRLLRPAVDRGRLLMSPREAEVLKDIDRLTEPCNNHPLWNEMMAQIVTLERPVHAPACPR